jgi:hypothetical protein
MASGAAVGSTRHQIRASLTIVTVMAEVPQHTADRATTIVPHTARTTGRPREAVAVSTSNDPRIDQKSLPEHGFP